MYVALLAVVVVCVVILTRHSSTTGVGLDGGAIEQLVPTPDAKILQQDSVGIDLAEGYEARLTINSTYIPDDQLTIVPALNQVTFQPGPGKEFEAFPAGRNCVTANYWRSETGPNQSTNRTWCFTVV